MILICECATCKHYMPDKFAGKPIKICTNPEGEYTNKILLPSFCCERYEEFENQSF